MSKELEKDLEMKEFEEIEGYAYCGTHKDKCLNDCINPLPNAMFADIN
ncbi:pseudouridine synthase [Paenibacillus lentus]|uniref:Pseudouridine synthase n=1 Tax=Paenibacillus lentus TaxID=1338368 RepID=A0A3Q8S904_9BACL|nr:pseudouridine synthase [Paenibacillus lentus]AZK45168.1 pseudouridine synthase [Paenibacillus lentus]